MKKLISIILTLVSIIPLCACGDKPFSDNPDAISRASNSVVMLTVYDKGNELVATGSGFAAFEDGIIVTNYHVIKDGSSYEANTEDGMYFKIDELVAFDADKDIAFLKTNANTKLNLLSLGKTDVLQKGEKVIAIGSPLGIINTVSDGMYSNRRTENGKEFLQFTAAISPGSSGGALFNDKGEVIGITSASYLEGQNLNLAIPSDTIQTAWENRELLAPMEQSGFREGENNTYSVGYVLKNKTDFIENADFNIIGFIYKYNDDGEKSSYEKWSESYGTKAYIEDSQDGSDNRIYFNLSNEELKKYSEETQDGSYVRIHCSSFDGINWVVKDHIEKAEIENTFPLMDYDGTTLSVKDTLQNAEVLKGNLVTVKGYVSSVHRQSGQRCFFIVDSAKDVLGIDVTDISLKTSTFEKEIERLADEQSIQVWVFGTLKIYNSVCDLKPGDEITVTGLLQHDARQQFTNSNTNKNNVFYEGYAIDIFYNY